MTEKVIDVPLDGEPVSRVPRVVHEFAASGMRLIVVPPGAIEIFYVLVPHVIDVNLTAVKHTQAVNSDKLVEQEIPADSLAWQPAGTSFRLRTEMRQPGLVLELDPARADALAAEVVGGGGVPDDVMDWRPDACTAALGREAIAHILQGAPMGRLYTESLGIAVATRTLWLASGNVRRAVRMRGALAGARLRRVQDYVEAHLADDLSLAALAAVACLSPSRFIHSFKATAGVSPWTWVTRLKITRAQELLRATDHPLTQIALACGFSSQSHFTNVFKRATGLTPSRWREQARS